MKVAFYINVESNVKNRFQPPFVGEIVTGDFYYPIPDNSIFLCLCVFCAQRTADWWPSIFIAVTVQTFKLWWKLIEFWFREKRKICDGVYVKKGFLGDELFVVWCNGLIKSVNVLIPGSPRANRRSIIDRPWNSRVFVWISSCCGGRMIYIACGNYQQW